MTFIADSSFIYALYSKHDSNHAQAKEFASTYVGKTIIPDIILPEVCYLFCVILDMPGYAVSLFTSKKSTPHWRHWKD